MSQFPEALQVLDELVESRRAAKKKSALLRRLAHTRGKEAEAQLIRTFRLSEGGKPLDSRAIEKALAAAFGRESKRRPPSAPMKRKRGRPHGTHKCRRDLIRELASIYEALTGLRARPRGQEFTDFVERAFEDAGLSVAPNMVANAFRCSPLTKLPARST